MISTIIYKKLDKLCGGEYHSPKQLLKYGKRAYEYCLEWEDGKAKESFFSLFLDTLIRKGVDK